MELTSNKLTEQRARLRDAAKNYQSTLSWYEADPDSPNAEQDCDEVTAAFKRVIGHQETDIIADLLDEIEELQERLCTDAAQPVAVPDSLSLDDALKLLQKRVPISDVQCVMIGWDACRAAMLKGGAE